MIQSVFRVNSPPLAAMQESTKVTDTPSACGGVIHYLILVKIINAGLFADYVNGHLPTILKYGGKITFRSIENSSVLGHEKWDAVVIQEWPSDSAFDLWWNSEEYQPWAKIRDSAASMSIIKCQNLLQSLSC